MSDVSGYTAIWVPHTRRYDCPKCRSSFMVVQSDGGAWGEMTPRFCPKCGHSSYEMRFGDRK